MLTTGDLDTRSINTIRTPAMDAVKQANSGHPGTPMAMAWIYDSHRITIEGRASLAFSDDVATRFISYGWNVTRVGDANDLEMLDRAFMMFKKASSRRAWWPWRSRSSDEVEMRILGSDHGGYSQKGDRHAGRNDRPRADGLEHGPAAHARWT